MSKNTFDDAIHIVKKIDYFLRMCIQDVEHLNYNEDAKMMLRFALSTHGPNMLNELLVAVRLAEKINNTTGDSTWEPTKDNIENVQEEWNKRFGNVREKKFKTENLFSEGQENQGNDTKDERTPPDNSKSEAEYPELSSEYDKLYEKLYYHKEYFKYNDSGNCSCDGCRPGPDIKEQYLKKVLDKEMKEEIGS